MGTQPAEQPTDLGDGAYARCDGPEIIVFTDRTEIDAGGNEVTTVRHWISLEPDAVRRLVALADRSWPGWR